MAEETPTALGIPGWTTPAHGYSISDNTLAEARRGGDISEEDYNTIRAMPPGQARVGAFVNALYQHQQRAAAAAAANPEILARMRAAATHPADRWSPAAPPAVTRARAWMHRRWRGVSERGRFIYGVYVPSRKVKDLIEQYTNTEGLPWYGHPWYAAVANALATVAASQRRHSLNFHRTFGAQIDPRAILGPTMRLIGATREQFMDFVRAQPNFLGGKKNRRRRRKRTRRKRKRRKTRRKYYRRKRKSRRRKQH